MHSPPCHRHGRGGSGGAKRPPQAAICTTNCLLAKKISMTKGVVLTMDNRKTEVTRIRITAEEKEQLKELAQKLDISYSALMRRFLDAGLHENKNATVQKIDNATVNVIIQRNMILAKIGSNVNQIARACNSGNTNMTLQNEVAQMQQLLEEMQKAQEVKICQ